MSGVPLKTCWAFNERWNNNFCYKVASCWLFLLINTVKLRYDKWTVVLPQRKLFIASIETRKLLALATK